MVAITGANGLLGSFMVTQFHQAGIPVLPLRRNSTSAIPQDLQHLTWRECDITDPVSVINALEGVTTVIHTAARVSFNPRKRNELLEINVTGTKNIVDACLSLSIPKLIHISSIAALGRKKEVRLMDENTHWVENDLNTDYAESKHLAELEVWRGAEEGLSVSVINPTVILAPANWERSSAQLFAYVWNERKFYSNTAINYVDVRDVVQSVLTLYKTNRPGERYIVNAGQIPIKELFEKIAGQFNKKAPRFKVNPVVLYVLALLEETRSRFTGKEPLITRQTAKLARESFEYSNQKATRELGIQFRNLDETLEWCCRHYLRTYTTNK